MSRVALRGAFVVVFVAGLASTTLSATSPNPAPSGTPGTLGPAPAGFTIQGNSKNGEVLYVANCASCHGKKGMGNGVIGKALTPPPADFTDVKRMGGKSDWELYNAVGHGGISVGLSPMMPAWEGPLKDQEIQDVVLYTKHFWSNKKVN